MYPPPALRAHATGVTVPFDALCVAAGVRRVVSGRWPDVRVHGEALDFKAVTCGRVVCCLGRPLLPSDPGQRARVMLDKLAYQFHDWAAREVMAAARRCRQREAPERAALLRRVLAPTPVRVLLWLRHAHCARTVDLAAALQLPQPHVSRALKVLRAAGLLVERRAERGVALAAAGREALREIEAER